MARYFAAKGQSGRTHPHPASVRNVKPTSLNHSVSDACRGLIRQPSLLSRKDLGFPVKGMVGGVRLDGRTKIVEGIFLTKADLFSYRA